MGITTSFYVDAPIDEVFAWHQRPGAFARLTPPFLPMRPVKEAESIADGHAELAIGGSRGPRWIAQHQRAEYDPPHRFVDTGTVPALGSLGALGKLGAKALPWRHQHDFLEEGGGTRVIDTVTTTVPRRLLEAVFAYRKRQLLDDLAVHAALREYTSQQLTVAITGSSGTVGTALSALLTTGGHRVVRLVRRDPSNDPSARRPDGAVTARHWNLEHPDPAMLDGVDVVVHLAGESIAGRFNDAHKAAIRDSRVGPTRALAEVSGDRPFVSASAIGYYGNDRDEPVDETSAPGEGFLAEVVQAWEDSARAATGRVVCVRTGIVQSSAGGALALQRPLFEAGVGGRLGSGLQWMSWIALDDLTDIYYRAIVDARLAGPVNAVAPRPVRNAEWAATMGRVLRRPTVLPVPKVGPQLLLGDEGAQELALASQRVRPAVLETLDHRFRFTELEAALRHELGRERL